MKAHTSDIRKSPVNPKKEFTKAQLNNLRESISKYGFSASLVVCSDYEKKSKYICIDGNSRFGLLSEMGITEVEVFVNDRITNEQELIDFISIFDSIKKKYDFESLSNLQDSMSEFTKNLLHISSYDKKYTPAEYTEKTITYIVLLPTDTIRKLKTKFIQKLPKDKEHFLIDKIDKIKDEQILEFVLNI